MGLGLTIIVIVLAALGGAAACYLTLVLPSTRRAAREREARATETARLAVAAERVPGLEEEAASLRDRLQDIDRKKAALEAALEAERKNHEERVAELTRIGAELEKKFAGLASEVLGKNSESFLKLVSERFEKHSAERQGRPGEAPHRDRDPGQAARRKPLQVRAQGGCDREGARGRLPGHQRAGEDPGGGADGPPHGDQPPRASAPAAPDPRALGRIPAAQRARHGRDDRARGLRRAVDHRGARTAGCGRT